MRRPTLAVAPLLLAAAALSAGVLARGTGGGRVASLHHRGDRRAGPDSARAALLLEALRRSDPVVCDHLAQSLGDVWISEAGGASIRAFADPGPSREAVRGSLAHPVRDPRALRLLAGALDEPNPCARRVAAKLLGRAQGAGRPLHEAARSPSPRVREAAVYAIGVADAPELLEDLRAAARDRDASVVAMAAWALGELEDPGTLPLLEELLRRDEPRVRQAAIW